MEPKAVRSFVATVIHSCLFSGGLNLHAVHLLIPNEPNMLLTWVALALILSLLPSTYLAMAPWFQKIVSESLAEMKKRYGIMVLVMELVAAHIFIQTISIFGGSFDWISMGYISVYFSTIALYGPAEMCKLSGATWGVVSGVASMVKVVSGSYLPAGGFALLSVYCFALIQVDAPYYKHYDLSEVKPGVMLMLSNLPRKVQMLLKVSGDKKDAPASVGTEKTDLE